MPTRTVLITDAHPDRLVTRDILEQAGFSVEVVADLSGARDRLGRPGVEAVLIDCQSCCDDSSAMARALKSDPATSGMVVLAVTSCDQLCDGCCAPDRGFDRAIPKDLVNDLPETLEELLNGPVA